VKLVIAITGASGARYAQRALELLSQVCGPQTQDPRPGTDSGAGPGLGNDARKPALEVHWVASATAASVWQTEIGTPMPDQVAGLTRWDRHDFSAPFASGSNAPDAVVLLPCSMSNLARVANGGGDDLVSRACEVALKERRRLILVVRETPLSLVHLRNMVAATEAGAIILPAVPSFYAGVETLAQAIDTVISRVFDRAGISELGPAFDIAPRWGASA